jgi:predicted TIM-barrel fold metal-dependent hydrolase
MNHRGTPPKIIDVNTVFGFWPWREVDISLERLLELMDQHNISRACCMSARGLFLDADRGNDEALDAAARYSQLFPVGALDMRTAPTARDIQGWVDRGLTWFRFAATQEWSPDNLVFHELLPALDDHKCVLLFAAGAGFAAIADIADQYASPIIVLESTFDTASELDRLLDRPHVYAEMSLLNAVGELNWLADQGHGDQLLFASRMPLCYPGAAMGLVNDLAVPEQLRREIYAGNAQRLMGAGA